RFHHPRGSLSDGKPGHTVALTSG
ncbi:uncharacterized protein METZ01_LOCUS231870, partial [marine metagenome]